MRLLFIAEERADGELDRVERLRAHAIRAPRGERGEVAVGRPPQHGQSGRADEGDPAALAGPATRHVLGPKTASKKAAPAAKKEPTPAGA